MATAIRSTLAIQVTMEAQNEDYVTTRPYDVADIMLQTVAGGMGETVTVNNAGVAVSSAMACADALGTIARSTVVAAATRTVASGATIRAAGSGANTRARVYLTVCPNTL